MKQLLLFIGLLFGVLARGQLMQTNSTPGGYQWVAVKGDSLMIMPHGSDTPNIGSTKYGKSTIGAFFYKTTDSTFWLRSSHKWNQVTGSGGGSGSGITSLGQGFGVTIANDSTYNVDTTLIMSVENFYNKLDSFSLVVTVDTTNLSYRIDTIGNKVLFANYPLYAVTNTAGDTTDLYFDSTYINDLFCNYFGGDKVLNGGVVTWIDSLKFGVTAATYVIGCQLYSSFADSVTLPAADVTNDRIDAIVATTSGTVTYVEGDPSPNPVSPAINTATQIQLATVQVPAGSTVPAGVTQEIIYDVNAGTPTEWNPTVTSGWTVNFANTSNPYHATIAADAGIWSVQKTITFTAGSTKTSTDYSLFKMFPNLKAQLPSTANVIVRFYNGNTAVTGNITLTSAFGFDKTIVGTYQNVTIPFSAVAFSSTSFNNVRITVTGVGSGFYLDYVQLQGGISNGNSNYITDIYRTPGGTTVYKVINGVASPAFIDSVGTGGSGTVTSVAASAGTGISVTGSPITTSGTLTITNTAPDQTVSLSSGTGISVTGTYPSFTVTNTAPSTTSGTVTSVAATAASGQTVTGSPITGTGTLAFAWTGAVQGDVPYFNGTNTLAYLNKNTTSHRYISNGGTTNNPSWEQVDLSDGVTGVLPEANGGTHQSTYTTGDLLYASATNTLSKLPIGTSAQHLVVSGGLPTWRDTAAAGAASVALSAITAGTATNTINSTDKAQEWQWNSLGAGTAFKLSSTSTAAASNTQKLFALSLSGANVTTTQTTYGIDISNSHTGTSSTNIGLQVSASGGTNNYAIVVPSGGGNVGIGTSAPNTYLHILSSSNDSASVKLESSSSGGAAKAAFLIKNDVGAYANFQINGSGNSGSGVVTANSVTIGSSSGANGINLVSESLTAPIIFAAGAAPATERMRINVNGTVGIGISNPNIGDFGGSFTVTGSTGLGIVGAYRQASSAATGTGFQVLLQNSSSSPVSYAYFNGIIEANTAGAHTGSLAFFTATAGALTEKMRITSTNRVGIGVTGPTAILHLKAGTASASTAPLKFNAGTVLTTPESGAMETNSSNELLYSTTTTTASRGFVHLGQYASTAVDATATSNMTTIEVTATGKTITLPTAVGIQGRMYTVKLTASGTGTVATTSSQTIDGSTTYSLSAQYKYVTVQSNNTNWIIIANN